MFTDPAVPSRAVAGTLRSRVCLNSFLLVCLAFLPPVAGLKYYAPRCYDLLVRRQSYVIN